MVFDVGRSPETPPDRLDQGAMSTAAGPALPAGMIVASCLSTWSGAALAVQLFDTTDPMVVLGMRLCFAAAILLLFARPSWPHSIPDRRSVIAFGVALAAMNTCIYQALNRIPLGVAVSLEIVGPISLYLARSRTKTGVGMAGVALVGVLALCLPRTGRPDFAGVLFALAAAFCWAGYLVLSAAVGRRSTSLDGLALAMAIAALLQLPFALPHLHPNDTEGSVVLLGLLVAVSSTVLPYGLEMAALRRLDTRSIAFLMTLSPVIAALSGLLFLGQTLTPLQWSGLIVIAAACALLIRGTQSSPGPDPEAPCALSTPSIEESIT